MGPIDLLATRLSEVVPTLMINRRSNPILAGVFSRVAAALVLGGLVAGNVNAQQAAETQGEQQPSSVQIRLGGGHSDNILRVPSDEESGTYSAAGVMFDMGRTSSRIDATLNGDVEHRSYSVDGIDNELYGSLDATLEVQAVPDRFSWFFGDDYGQVRGDPFRIDSPANREYINIMSTGPRLSLPVGNRMTARLAATLAERSFEDSSVLDSETVTTELGFARALNTTTELGFMVSKRETEYDVLPVRDNDVETAYVSYDSRLASGSASLSLGRSWSTLGSTKSSAPYISLEWGREIGARSVLTLTLANDFVDVGQNLGGGNAVLLTPQALDDLLLSADVYERFRAGLSYVWRLPRTTIQLGVNALENSYETDQALDNDQQQLSIRLTRTLSAQLDAGIDMSSSNRGFDASGQDDEDRRARLWLTRQFANRLSIQFAYERSQRDSLVTNSFDENAVRLLFQYDLNSQARQ